MRALLCSLTVLVLASPISAVIIDWMTVGDAGNACDPQTDGYGRTGCYGAVGYVYSIGTHEVTTEQYAEFLNAVARTDPNGLYIEAMGVVDDGHCPECPPDPSSSITRSGSPGDYTYEVIAGREAMPMNCVTFWNALRFANWLENDQPTGPQNDWTTEDGAYTITAQGIAQNTITRNPHASVFVPSEDEWYKAAYYDATTQSYFTYPAGSNAQMICSAPTASPNRANCESAALTDRTDVGSYPGSPGPYGTFDQGGNVWEWNEAIFDYAGYFGRSRRGGSYYNPASNTRNWAAPSPPGSCYPEHGFRVATLPEPSRVAQLIAAALGLALAARRRGVSLSRGSRGGGRGVGPRMDG